VQHPPPIQPQSSLHVIRSLAVGAILYTYATWVGLAWNRADHTFECHVGLSYLEVGFLQTTTTKSLITHYHCKGCLLSHHCQPRTGSGYLSNQQNRDNNDTQTGPMTKKSTSFSQHNKGNLLRNSTIHFNGDCPLHNFLYKYHTQIVLHRYRILADLITDMG